MAKTPSKKTAGKPAAQPLSRERIVSAALSLVAEETLSGLSTRKLGERLGCEAMSIYHHFPSKQHLLDALVEYAINSVQMPDEGLPPVERLRAAMHAYRGMAHRFPALFPLVAVHRLNMPAGVRFIESILSIVRAVVPDRELAARQFRILGYYLVGACIDETSGYARGPSAADPVSNEYIAEHCPNLIASAEFFQASHWDKTFELGVDALVRLATD
jgi:AcrR family transcriptional regulator